MTSMITNVVPSIDNLLICILHETQTTIRPEKRMHDLLMWYFPVPFGCGVLKDRQACKLKPLRKKIRYLFCADMDCVSSPTLPVSAFACHLFPPLPLAIASVWRKRQP